MSHTTGPWFIEQIDAGTCLPTHVEISASSHGAFAQAVWKMEDDERTPRGEANDRLIAAAPDLLEALRDTLDFVERHSNRWDGANGKHPAEVVEYARAAIAKATNA